MRPRPLVPGQILPFPCKLGAISRTAAVCLQDCERSPGAASASHRGVAWCRGRGRGDVASDVIYERVREQFSEKEISDLSFAIMSINAWNRINVGFQTVPGSADKAFGLDKANLE
jgi:hypothetical protein